MVQLTNMKGNQQHRGKKNKKKNSNYGQGTVTNNEMNSDVRGEKEKNEINFPCKICNKYHLNAPIWRTVIDG